MFRTATLALLAALSLTACSSAPEPSPYQQPSWYLGFEEPEAYFYGYGIGRSENPNLALRQAQANANANLATAITQFMETEFREAVGQSDGFSVDGTMTNAIQTRVQQTMTGLQPVKAHSVNMPDGSIQVWVQVRRDYNQSQERARAILEEFDIRMSETRSTAL